MNVVPIEEIACNVCGGRDSVLLYPSTLGQRTLHAEDFRCTSTAECVKGFWTLVARV